MNKILLVVISILGALGVVLGALGAHVLKQKLGVDGVKNYETGVKYHMFHVLVLLSVQLLPQFNQQDKLWISLLFIFGIVCFSGSLYFISTGGVTAKSIWFITPLGGLMFVAGWLLMAYKFFIR